MIRFKKLTIKNLLSVGNIPITIDLDRAPLTILSGDSGTGKSTLTSEALVFGLYGKSYRGLKKGQLVNSINQKDCQVSVQFSTNGADYEVIRSIKPNKLEIYKNGKLIDQDASIKDYQEYLETNILKMDMKVFRQISILSVSNYIPFMEMSAADRREVIEDILDIRVFAVMNQLLKDRISNANNELKELKIKREHIGQLINAQKLLIDSLKNKDKTFKESTQKYIDQIQKQLDDIQLQKNEINEKIVKLKKLVGEDYDKKIASLSKEISQYQQNLNDYRSKIKQLKSDLKFFDKHDHCPTCRQEITPEYKEQKKQELKNNIVSFVEKAKEIEIDIAKFNDKLQKIQKVEQEIQLLKQKIEQLQSSESEKIKTINDLKTNLQEIDQSNIQQYNQEKIKMKKLIEGRKRAEEKIQQKMYELEDFEICKSILKDTGVKARIIKRFIPVLNAYLHDVLSKMGLNVRFAFKEDFTEVVQSRYHDDFTYANFSAGEKVRINLAITLAFREISKLKNSVSTNILIIDEAVDALDNDNIDRVMEFFNTKALGNVSVFLISHKIDVVDRSRHVIKLEKDQTGFTRIVPNQ